MFDIFVLEIFIINDPNITTMTLTEFEKLLADEPAVMLYFYNDVCGVCHTLWPKVESVMKKEFPLISLVRVHAAESRELAGQLRMLSVPGILLYMDGREYYRTNGLVAMGELESKIARPYSLMFDQE